MSVVTFLMSLWSVFGAEEHLVEAKGVGAVVLDYHVGVDDVVHRLRHFLDGPAADVLAVLEDEVCRSVLGAPGLEGFEVEDVVLHDVHIHMNGCDVVLVFEAEGDEGVGLLDAIDEVGAALYHALIDKLLEGFLLLAYAEVEEELVPEA